MAAPPPCGLRVEDLGLDLCVLAFHLFKRCTRPEEALKELCLRCQCSPATPDFSACQSIDTLHTTVWYATMRQRFADITTRIKHEHKADLAEAEDLIRSLYPNGCSLSEYADATQTCAAMLPFSIPGDTVKRFIDVEGAKLSSQKRHTLSCEDLVSGLTTHLIMPWLLPSRWWAAPADNTAAPFEATRIGLSVAPLRIAIEFRETTGGAVATRIIPLEGHLTATGPTSHVARRLASVHGSLVNEATLQKALVSLQRLMQTGAPSRVLDAPGASQSAPIPAATPVRATTGVHSSSSSSSSAADVPQKADVGLLYRDPEKALENVDLNDADDMTVKEFKEAMEVKFASNALRPGDEGYVYDRRVEFKPTAKSEWDDDSD